MGYIERDESVHELEMVIDGDTYLFIEPRCTYPSVGRLKDQEDPSWKAHRIFVECEQDDMPECFRSIADDELDDLNNNHFQEVFNAILADRETREAE